LKLTRAQPANTAAGSSGSFNPIDAFCRCGHNGLLPVTSVIFIVFRCSSRNREWKILLIGPPPPGVGLPSTHAVMETQCEHGYRSPCQAAIARYRTAYLLPAVLRLARIVAQSGSLLQPRCDFWREQAMPAYAAPMPMGPKYRVAAPPRPVTLPPIILPGGGAGSWMHPRPSP